MASEGISGALHPALMRFHVAAEGGIDAALSEDELVFVRKRCYFSLQNFIQVYHAKH